MNPQMNKVFSKLAKAEKLTELKSEKVELSAISDLGRIVIQANSLFQDAKQVDINQDINDADKLVNKREELIDLQDKSKKNQLKESQDLQIKLQKELEKKIKDFLDKSNKNLQNIQKALVSNAKEQNAQRKSLNKKLEKTVSTYNALVKIERELFSNMNKVLKQSKDLGLDVRSIKVWSEGDKLVKPIDVIIKKLQKEIEKGREVLWNDDKSK